MILVRDDDGDQRLLLQTEEGVIDAVVHAFFDLVDGDFGPHPAVMGPDGPRPRLEGIELALGIGRRGIHVAAPVVQDLRDVDDLFRPLGHAEDEIIVLGAVEGGVKEARLFLQGALHDEKMTDIVHAGQQVLVEIRLEVRVEQRAAVHVELVFVGIEAVAVRVLPDGLRALIQRLFRQDVVVVAEYHKIALCLRQGGVRVARDAAVLPEDLEAHPAVPVRVFLKDLSAVLSRGASVRNADLQLRIRLVQQGIQELPEILLRCLVYRDDDGKQGAVPAPFRGLLPLPCELLRGGLCLLVPLRVFVVAVDPLQLVLRLQEQRLQAVLLEILPGHSHGLHIAEIPDLFHALMRHAGPLRDQLFVIFDPGGMTLAADHQPVVLSSFVGKTDVEPEILIDDFLEIDLAHVVPAGRDDPEFHGLFLLIQHRIFHTGSGISADHPAVQGDVVLPDPDYVDFIFHSSFFLVVFPVPSQDSGL